MLKHIEWKKGKDKYSSGSTGHRCGIRVFSCFWDSVRPKDHTSNKPWRLSCSLPAVKNDLGHFETEEDARQLAEKAFVHFLKRLELTTLELSQHQ